MLLIVGCCNACEINRLFVRELFSILLELILFKLQLLIIFELKFSIFLFFGITSLFSKFCIIE